MSPKQVQIRIVLVLGILAALVSNLSFNIAGIPNLTTDPREIVALSALLIVTNWRAALIVGLLAGLGGPYNETLWVTVLMHMFALPVGYFLYRQIRIRYSNQWMISILWAALVLFLYAGVFATVFVLSHFFRGEFAAIDLIKTYFGVVSAMFVEALLTTGITLLILQIKLAREERRVDEHLLSLLVESNEFGIWDWHVKEDQLIANLNLIKMLKYKPGELGTKIGDFKKLIHPDDQDRINSILDKMMHIENYQAKLEYRMQSKDGNWNYVLGTATVVERDELNQPIHIIGTVMDISELKQAEHENEKLREQLNQVQKMEAIGTLAGGIAHDFNNLLTVINGHAEMASMRVEEKTPVHKDVTAIHSAGKRAARLTAQLLAFSRKQIYQAKILDMNSIIAELDRMQRRLIGEDIEVELVLAEKLPKIQGDPSQIEQILLNLIVNARDAITAKTNIAAEKKITIETVYLNLDETYISEHTYVQPGNYVVLGVSDNGIGMDSETRNKIFEPFYTTKEVGKGTGLGLSTVYGIIKQNDGYINVYSEPGEGTTFKVFWPVSKGQISSEEKQKTEELRASGTEEILLVEDDAAVREFAETALSDRGYRVLAKEDGQEAFQALKEGKINPKLLITDLIMPKMNGRELAQKVITELPDCKVLYASGYTDNHIVHQGALDKGVNFIQKPYSIERLTRKVRQILDEL